MMTKTHLQAILFDLDGTLLDTADDLGAALNHLLHLHQRPLITAQRYRPVASDGAKGLLELGFGKDLVHLDFDSSKDFDTYNLDARAINTPMFLKLSLAKALFCISSVFKV